MVMSDVKPTSKRAQKAGQTRQRILQAARELFVERGYGATTLQEVADRAGVAVQTIYYVFSNKPALLKELVDVTIAGDDEPVATMDRPWFRDALAAGTADAQLRAHVSGTREILERLAPIVSMAGTAAKALVGKPGAREGVSADHAADLLFGLLSPELYLLLVRDRGWHPEQWERWVYDTLRPQLCAPSPREQVRR
jgi:AcrR family transcriptional regulator